MSNAIRDVPTTKSGKYLSRCCLISCSFGATGISSRAETSWYSGLSCASSFLSWSRIMAILFAPLLVGKTSIRSKPTKTSCSCLGIHTMDSIYLSANSPRFPANVEYKNGCPDIVCKRIRIYCGTVTLPIIRDTLLDLTSCVGCEETCGIRRPGAN